MNVLLVTSTFGGVVTFIALYARDNGLGEYVGLYFTLMAIGMGLARIFSGQIFDRFGPRIISMIGIVAAAFGFYLLGSVPNCSCFLISSGVIGIGIGIVVPSFQTMANNVVVKERRGVANSTFLTGLDLGIGDGSILAGWMSDLFSMAFAFRLNAAVLVIALILFVFKTLPHYNRHLISE